MLLLIDELFFGLHIFLCKMHYFIFKKYILSAGGGWGDGRKQFRDALVALADYKFRCAKRSKMRSKTLHL